MDRLKKPKDFLEKLRLTDSDYQDSGMINHIADLLERYSTEQLIIANVVGSAKKGRDPIFKCAVCSKFIAYDDIPRKVKIDFTPDTEYTTEATSFTHLHCI